MLLNLIGNAIDALKECDTRGITVHAEETADSVSIEVKDTGPGVPDELRQRVFEPFMTTKPQGEGTGLGLSIAHRVATAHGGSLTLHDDPDGGAAFRLTLPRSARAVGEATTALGTAIVFHPDAMIAGLLSDGLRLIGFEPRCMDEAGNLDVREPALAVVPRRSERAVSPPSGRSPHDGS